MGCIPEKLCLEIHRLVPEFHDSSNPAPQGHRPNISTPRFPIGGDDRLPGEIPALLQVVVDEVLQEHLVHIFGVALANGACASAAWQQLGGKRKCAAASCE